MLDGDGLEPVCLGLQTARIAPFLNGKSRAQTDLRLPSLGNRLILAVQNPSHTDLRTPPSSNRPILAAYAP